METMFEVGSEYSFIYDDKGYKVVKKQGILLAKEGNILKLMTDKGEELINTNNIVRGNKVESGTNGRYSNR